MADNVLISFSPSGAKATGRCRRNRGKGGGHNAAQSARAKTSLLQQKEMKQQQQRHGPICSLDLKELYSLLVSSSSTSTFRQQLPFATKFSESIHAKGILNNRNYCFMNATMQALIFLPPFAQLAVSAVKETVICPTLSFVGKWLLSYWAKPVTQSVPPLILPKVARGQGLSLASSFCCMATNGSAQEDATEFLHSLLEVIQTELHALEKHYKNNASRNSNRVHEGSLTDNAQTKGWKFVRGREQFSLREEQHVGSSIMLNTIFGGTVENYLKGTSKVKNHASVIVESFFFLSLDICFDAECSIEVALERTLQKERIYDSVRVKDLSKTVKLRQLPLVLILELRRWAVTAEGELVKLDNKVRFTKTLVIPKSCCVNTKLSNADRTYELVSFVAHQGSSTNKGHYVAYLANALLPTAAAGKFGEMLVCCNDATVVASRMREAVETEAVYLILYQRKR